jgi:hypothetical protein
VSSVSDSRPVHIARTAGWVAAVAVIVISTPALADNACTFAPSQSSNPTEQRFGFDYRDVPATARSGAADTRILDAEPGRPVKLTLKGKTLTRPTDRRAGKPVKNALTVTVVPIVGPIENGDGKWALTLDVTAIKPVKTGLEDAAGKRLAAASKKLEQTLRAWRRKLTTAEKNQLQTRGSISLSLREAVSKSDSLTLTGAGKIVAVARVVRATNLYNVAKGLAVRQGQFNRLKQQLDAIKLGEVSKTLASLRASQEGLRQIDRDVVPALLKAFNLFESKEGSQSLIEYIDKTDLPKAEEKRRILEDAKKKDVLYVDIRGGTPKASRGKQPSQRYIPVGEAMKQVRGKRDRVAENLRQAYRDQYARGSKEITSLDQVEKKVRRSKSYRDQNRALKWLKGQNKTHLQQIKQAHDSGITRAREDVGRLRKERATHVEKIRRDDAEFFKMRSGLNGAYDIAVKTLARDRKTPGSDIFHGKASAENMIKARLWVRAKLRQRREAEKRTAGTVARTLDRLENGDRRLAVVGRQLLEQRYHAACRLRKALGTLDKETYGPVLTTLKQFNGGLGTFKDMLGKAGSRLGHLEKAVKYLGEKSKSLDYVKGRVELFSNAVGVVDKWTKRAESLATLKNDLDRNDPMFLVTVLSGSKEIAGSVPVLGQTIGRFLGFYADAAKAIISKAQNLRTELMRKTLKVIRIRPTQEPERHLYSEREIRAAIQHGHYSTTDAEIKGLATEFQARRIMFLLASGKNR